MATEIVQPIISVCIPTFHRTESLSRLLTALAWKVRRPVPIEIVVCDNDAECSARSVVSGFVEIAPVPVVYLVEPVQNISGARNRLVRQARGAWIAFIDDDELPCDAWLEELWNIAALPGTVIAKGPVARRLPADAPAWLVAMPYLGLDLPHAGAALTLQNLSGGNILVLREALMQVRGDDGPFDRSFGLRGGEDILAFGRMALLHPGQARSAPAAMVDEFWGAERLKARWLLRRSFRSGQIWCDVESLLLGSHRRFIRIPGAMLRLAAKLLSAPLLATLNKPRRIQWLVQFAGLAGQASTVLPFRYQSYLRMPQGPEPAATDGKQAMRGSAS